MPVEVDLTTAPTTSAPWWRPLARADRTALIVMLALPTVLFGVPAALGHPAIAADNLIQNFPLRVLSGRQIASGHLPLMNPLADSGTPLLGGMNAGSLFPLTIIFAFLPAILAWVVNLVAVYAAAAIGLFSLARYHGLRTTPSLAGALVYAYVGAMTGQMVHLGVVQGYAMLPWEILCLLVLAEGVRRGGSWRTRARSLSAPIMGLGVLWGLTALSGEPRAIAEMELVVLVVGAVVLVAPSRWRPATWSQRAGYVGAVALGVIWGALIGLAQLVTGWGYIAVSQRSNLGYQFFGSGSLAVRWSALWLVPDLFGGNGIVHQPSYFASYNLPEVTGYAGVAALVATAAYAGQLIGRRRRERVREFAPYGVLAVVGVWATWGNYTPVGRVFWWIPLFSSTRLQSRNVILLDLAASVLLAWWLQRVGDGDEDGASLVGARRYLTFAPVAIVVTIVALALFDGRRFLHFLGLATGATRWVPYERPTLVLHLVIALAFALVVVAVRRARVRWLLVILALDAVAFFAFNATGLAPGRAGVMPSRANAVAHLGLTGRFAMVDPTGAAGDTFESLGLANMNVFTELPSIQGYGSLIDAYYGSETGTHPLFRLDACNLVRGRFRQLRLAALVLASNQLMVSSRVDPQYCVPARRTETAFRYFGQLVHVREIRLEGVDGEPLTNTTVSLQMLTSTGAPTGDIVTIPGSTSLSWSPPTAAPTAGFVVHSPSGVRVGSALVTLESGVTYQLTTPFQQAVATRSWRLRETSGSLAYFRATSLLPSAWVSSLSTGRIVSVRNALWGDTWVRVHARSATTVLHSVEWIPGWRANAQRVGTSQVIALTVQRSGLIQSVRVPPGEWVIHYHYHAPHIELGLLGSLLGGLLLVVAFVLRRRRRPRVEA